MCRGNYKQVVWLVVLGMCLGSAQALSFLQNSASVVANPADMIITRMSDTSIVAEVNITNMGTTPSDFNYEYCIVSSFSNACGGGDDLDYQTGTRMIANKTTWSPSLGLELYTSGTYYFKVNAKGIAEDLWASASKQFVATATTAIPVGGGGGGVFDAGVAKYVSLDIVCDSNNLCPIGYYCQDVTCERLRCNATSEMSPDGHYCVQKTIVYKPYDPYLCNVSEVRYYENNCSGSEACEEGALS
jgi:hypothetical protein